ncbi:hypothetical protein DRQ09_05760, partial [candidate division KSB1 bacterium]
MKKKMFITNFLITGFIVIFLCLCLKDVEGQIDLKGLQKTGIEWTVLQFDSTSNNGAIKLHHQSWLMHFIHCRPLTPEREKISVEYTRHLMLNFWGPDMPFELSRNYGETEVAGHKAYFVDGTIMNGNVHTRFIVWNCPETKRQFIADCNINVRRKTPQKLLKLQYDDISHTISCHKNAKIIKSPFLSQKCIWEKYNLSFYIPENWRTEEYVSSEWYPDGMTDTNGSLWTLLTDSEKHIELLWNKNDGEISKSLFYDYIKQIESNNTIVRKDTLIYNIKIRNLFVEDLIEKNEYISGEGKFDFVYNISGKKYSSPYIFKVLLWKNKDKSYFLLASIIAIKEFWGIP